VIEALDVVKTLEISDRPIQIADIGTGSGTIAVTLAKHLPNTQLTAVDQSDAVLKIAAWNAEQHQVDSQITFAISDLLASIDSPEQFDMICSNPPYVSEAEFAELDSTVRDFEPRAALVSGPSGTEVIERIVRESPDRLHPGGRLIIELSPMIADKCEQMVIDHQAYGDERFIKDLEGNRRILSVMRV
jgi:release factor glutamine methyltransferase